jgi:hypothetical protein
VPESSTAGTAGISPAPDPLDLTSPAGNIRPNPPPTADTANSLDASSPSPEHHSTNWHPAQTLTEKIQDKMYENSAVINTFIAGGLAGATSRTVVSPLERLKIIL